MTASKSLSSFFHWVSFLGFAVFLYIGFTLPLSQIPEVFLPANDKALHFFDFLILTLLGFQAFFYSVHPFFHQGAGGKASAFSLFYGAYLEWAQTPVPGRGASFTDWMADALGVLVAWIIFQTLDKAKFYS